MAGSQHPRSSGARKEIPILIAALEGLPGRSWSPQSQKHRTRQWSMEGRGETPQPHSPSPSFLPLMPPICQAQPEARGWGEPEGCSPQKGSEPEGIWAGQRRMKVRPGGWLEANQPHALPKHTLWAVALQITSPLYPFSPTFRKHCWASSVFQARERNLGCKDEWDTTSLPLRSSGPSGVIQQ